MKKKPTDSPIVSRIRSACADRAWCVFNLSQAAHVPVQTIYAWYRGQRAPGDPAILARVAEALGVTLDWLISGKPKL